MASTSGIENQEMIDENRPLKERVETMIQNSIVPPLTSQCCIFRVPKVLRKIKESAYTPLVISIGPFHHKNDELQFMEKQKVRYLDHVLQVYKVNLDSLLTIIKDSEENVRQSYGEYIELSSDDFLTMVLLDGVFIVEYFRRFAYPELNLKDENDKYFYTPQLRNSIWNDLILLENQLPFFVLESLYNLISPENSSQSPFLEITCFFLNGVYEQKSQAKVLHFTDLMRTMLLDWKNTEPIHQENNEEKEHISVYNAKELEESGINFKAHGSSDCLLDIKFSVNDGVFLIPQLLIHDGTEGMFRNIMALEQYMYVNEKYICDYVILMDRLINTYKDVEILVRKCIISNILGDHEEVAALFNNLGREIIHDQEKSYYSKLIHDLDKYYKKPQHKWRATLKRDYFSSPWQIASVIAATILLVLTMLQTIKAF